jgi:phosphoserine phosphatase
VPQPGDLVAFDVDGTLIDHDEGKVVWQLLNRRFLGEDSVNDERLRLFRQGELSYAEWVALDVQGWQEKGATETEVRAALAGLRPVAGARETLAELGRRGYRLALISGTIDIALDHCLPDLEIDEVYLNRLHFAADGSIAGWEATPYDMDGKARCLAEIAARRGLSLERSAFIGDHLNDVAVARVAGFSIAWNPRSPDLEATATVTVRGDDLRSILRYFPA